MPVSTETSITGPYTPNGVTTDFAFDFKAASASEIVAVDQDGNTISTALYSVTVDSDEGGTLSFGTAPELADYSLIYVVGDPALTQPSDFDNAGPSFNPAALTRALDRAALRDLKQQAEIDRALKLPFGQSYDIPSGASDSVLGWDDEGEFGLLGRALFKGDTGDPGAPGGNFLSAVNVNDEGALPNVESEAASTANLAAFAAAVTAAAAAGVDVFIPAGTYWIKADNSTTTGLSINVPANKTVRFIGESGTEFKRLPNTAMASTSALIFLWANTGATIEFHNVVFDGNEANCELDSAANFFTGDGSTTVYTYTGTVTPSVFIIGSDGDYTPVSSTLYAVTGSSGNYTVTFDDAPPSGVDYVIYYPYKHEQSANIKWRPGTGRPKALRFFNCDVGKNRVGDGYHANVRVDHFMAANCSTLDSLVRRVRADWQFSRYATYNTLMSNIACNSWESEPSDTQEASQVFLSNIHTRSAFDLAGDVGGATVRPVRVQLVNVRCDGDPKYAGLPACNFYRVHGEAVNCNFRLIDRFQRCKLTLRGGSVTVADNGSGGADSIQIWHDQVMEGAAYSHHTDRFGNYVVFDGVRFLKDATVTSGDFVTMVNIPTEAGQFGDEMIRAAFIDCHTPEPLDHLVAATRSGEIEIVEGKLSANTAIVQYAVDGSYYNRLRMVGSPFWNAPAVLHIPNSINVSGAIIELSGAINTIRPKSAGTMQVIDSSSISSAPNVTWNVDMVAYVAASPSGSLKALPGLVAKLSKPVAGGAVSYRASYSGGDQSGYGGTTWEVLDQSVLTGSATYDAASIAAGANVSTTVTVTGAALGDHVESVSFSLDAAGVVMHGYVSAANTVTVYLQNLTGSAVDLGNGTLRARVRKALA